LRFLLETLRLGLGNLRLHMLRSILTSLGIILGVAAVIIMVSIGEGNKQAALREIQALGATNIIVRSTQPPESGSFGAEERQFIASYGITREDERRLRASFPDAEFIVPLKAVGDEISHEGMRMVSQTFGTTPKLRDIANLRIDPRGRYITDEDMELRSAVAVIGSEVAKKFFKLKDPLGSTIRIGQQVFTVVGVLQPIGLAGGAGSALVGRDLNNDVHIPISTAALMFGDRIARRTSGSFSYEDIELSEVYITARTTGDVILTSERVRRVMEVGHPDLGDVEIIVPWELLENAKRTSMAMNILLTLVASISLLVGGIGIMNIMLASVTERIREIGIRRALGATRRHIQAQFLVETGTLSTVGGLLGIGLGIGFSLGIEQALPWFLNLDFVQARFETSISFETQITLWSIIASFFVAAGVGLIFGIYPAVVASRQDPIVALRHD
jgi:putative ABC transport system permease protein